MLKKVTPTDPCEVLGFAVGKEVVGKKIGKELASMWVQPLDLFSHTTNTTRWTLRAKYIAYNLKIKLIFTYSGQKKKKAAKEKKRKAKKKLALAGNRTRASRVAGENSTTEPPVPCLSKHLILKYLLRWVPRLPMIHGRMRKSDGRSPLTCSCGQELCNSISTPPF